MGDDREAEPGAVEPRATEPEPGTVEPVPAPVRTWGFRVLAGSSGLVLGLLLTFSVERLAGRGEMLRGVVLDGRSLAGSDEATVARWAGARALALNRASFDVLVGDKKLSVTPSELGIEIDAAATSASALAQGREGSAPAQLGFWLSRLASKKTLEFRTSRDSARFEKKTAELQAQALLLPLEPSVFFDGQLGAVFPEETTTIDAAAFGRVLEQRLATGDGASPLVVPLRRTKPALSRVEVEARLAEGRTLIEKPIVLVTADGAERVEFAPALLGAALRTRVEAPRLVLELSLEALASSLKKARARLERKARSVTFDVDAQGAITVRPSETGQRIDEPALLAELFRAANTPQRHGVLPLRIEEPTGLTLDEAANLGVKGLVAQFATRHPCCEARVQNIHSVAAQLDGYVLRPGETFSLNQFLGPRTNEGGYVEAPTIVRGKMKATAGGGISQFATTLFNAVFDGGYEIIQRQPHSYWFPRYPEGLEATVSFPSPDLIFRNDTRSGLLIKTRYDSTSIRVLLYGDNEGRRVERKVSRRSHTVEPPLEYEANAELKPDDSKLVTRGQTGWSVMTTRVLHFADGTKTEQGREVVYQPKPHVVAVHPCRIPKGMKGYTGDTCPEPEEPPEEEGTEVEGETEAPVEGETQ